MDGNPITPDKIQKLKREIAAARRNIIIKADDVGDEYLPVIGINIKPAKK